VDGDHGLPFRPVTPAAFHFSAILVILPASPPFTTALYAASTRRCVFLSTLRVPSSSFLSRVSGT
jgi:hypothetical protein